MLNLSLAIGALVLFTIGFFLVKKGKPFARVGGDAYARRRRRRMLGWMMWTTAAVMVMLLMVNLTSTDLPEGQSIAQSGARPDIEHVRTPSFSEQLIPNLLRPPALEANAINTPVPAASSSAKPALDLSMNEHPQLLTPTMETPLPTAPVTPETSDTVIPKQDLESGAASGAAADNAPPVHRISAPPPLSPERVNQLKAQLAALNLVLQKDPKNINAYIMRGNAYAYQRLWDEAKANYQQALALGPASSSARYNLADIDFMEGNYDAARPGFAALVKDPDFGDLAKYSVFLCDLFGGHEEQAAKELAVFNDVGSEASYYFANVAWSFYHRKNDDAQNWFQSATQIFSQDKVNLYAKPLIDLGYISSGAT